VVASEQVETEIPTASQESIKCALIAEQIISNIDATISTNEAYFGDLDTYAGDGDHGIGMKRGSDAALKAARHVVAKGAGIGTTLEIAGDAWADRAGGTSGAIWGIILREIGKELGDTHKPVSAVIVQSIKKAKAEVMSFGKAQLGDKTLVDALVPFASTLEEEVLTGKSFDLAWRIAAAKSIDSAAETASLLPKIGRARPHAEKSVGHPDPGAVSFSYIVRALEPLMKDVDK
jgi:dihydroxyacetone kinase